MFAKRKREHGVGYNAVQLARTGIDGPTSAIPVLNERGSVAAHVATGGTSGCPNVGRRNSTNAIECSHSSGVRAGYYFPRCAIPVFNDGALPQAHPRGP